MPILHFHIFSRRAPFLSLLKEIRLLLFSRNSEAEVRTLKREIKTTQEGESNVSQLRVTLVQQTSSYQKEPTQKEPGKSGQYFQILLL